MSIVFEIGRPSHPRGHALVYFHSREANQVVATYVLALPIKMDFGKYLPPLLASQFGGIDMGDLSTFAAPPMPEVVDSIEVLERLAKLRDDDLVYAGPLSISDVTSAIQDASDAVQEYAALYNQYLSTQPVPAVTASSADQPADDSDSVDIQRMVYELLTERDRLSEVAKLVGSMRFAQQNKDEELAKETDVSLEALESLLPNHFWVDRIRAAARDASDHGANMARLYVDRCYKLLDEDYGAVKQLEEQITSEAGDSA
jgi:hypothetical protein